MITDTLSTIVFILSKKKRDGVKRNLRLILKTKITAKDVWKVFQEYGRYWADLPNAYTSFSDATKIFQGDKLPAPDSNFLGITFHLGNFELFGTIICQNHNQKLNVVAERLKPEFLSNYFKEKRSLYNMETISHDDLRNIIKTLKHGKGLGILADRLISGNGVEARLFGEKVTMPLNLVEYAIKEKIPIYISYCVKDRQKFRIFCKKLDESTDFPKAVNTITETLENAVTEYPYQWHVLSPIC
ncbi:Lauroyl/myristoyl acyltransferase [Chitinispirillum alkaliphilum]|nr:Lauroyl/myristoyl acyltransferase [Chitinispirillum alkaliphilum]